MHCAVVALLRRCAAWLRCWHAVFDTAEAYAVDGYPNQAEVIVGKALQLVVESRVEVVQGARELLVVHAQRLEALGPSDNRGAYGLWALLRACAGATSDARARPHQLGFRLWLGNRLHRPKLSRRRAPSEALTGSARRGRG